MMFVFGCQTSDLAKSGDGRGKVLRIDTLHHQVTLDHNRIPAMMQSLIMSYTVPNNKIFSGLQVGDSVSFTLSNASSGKYLVTAMSKIPTVSKTSTVSRKP